MMRCGDRWWRRPPFCSFAAGRSSEGQALAQGALGELLPPEPQADLPHDCRAHVDPGRHPGGGLPIGARALGAPRAAAPPAAGAPRLFLGACGRTRGRPADAGQHRTGQVCGRGRPDDSLDGRGRRRALDLAEITRRGARRRPGAAERTPSPLDAVFTDYVIIEALGLRDDFDEALRMLGGCVTAAQRHDQIWVAGVYERQRGRLWAAAGGLGPRPPPSRGSPPAWTPTRWRAPATPRPHRPGAGGPAHREPPPSGAVHPDRGAGHGHAAGRTPPARRLAAGAVADGRGRPLGCAGGVSRKAATDSVPRCRDSLSTRPTLPSSYVLPWPAETRNSPTRPSVSPGVAPCAMPGSRLSRYRRPCPRAAPPRRGGALAGGAGFRGPVLDGWPWRRRRRTSGGSSWSTVGTRRGNFPAG